MTPVLNLTVSPEKKLYFASDFHLGLASRTKQDEVDREKWIVSWLESIEKDAGGLFLVGDTFDFWFEYKHVVPKGFVRFLGKIASLADKGIPIYIFTGNHDQWMFDYLKAEFGAHLYTQPVRAYINNLIFMIGHGDGLGPGDKMYKLLKSVFVNPFAQWIFRWIHPDIGVAIARRWSRSSRLRKEGMDEEFLGENEYLVNYCRQKESLSHHDYYIFGHRHLPLKIDIGPNSVYFNLGEWFSGHTYGVFDGKTVTLEKYKPGHL